MNIVKWFLGSVVVPLILPLVVSFLLIRIQVPLMSGSEGYPCAKAWLTLISSPRILLVGILCGISVLVEFNIIGGSSAFKIPRIKWYNIICVTLVSFGIVAYSGFASARVLESSENTKHMVKVNNLKIDFSCVNYNDKVSGSEKRRYERNKKIASKQTIQSTINPMSTTPLFLTGLLIFFSTCFKYKLSLSDKTIT